MYIRLFLGHYFHTDEPKIVSNLKRVYCLVFVFLFTIFFTYNLEIDLVTPDFYIPIKFGVLIILSFFFETSIIEQIMCVNSVYYKFHGFQERISCRVLLYQLAEFIVVLIKTGIYLFALREPPGSPLLDNVIIFSIGFSNFPKVFFLDLIYEAMKSLKRSLQKKSTTLNAIGRDDINYEILMMKQDLFAYKRLMNRFEIASVELQIGETANCLVAVLDLMHIFLSLFALPVTSELITTEQELILDILAKQMDRCLDKSLARQKQRVRNYMKVRPYEFYIFGATRVDLAMPLKFIVFCVSHLIVLIQLRLKK
ncbi:unnamed protein product [Leptosia nina]|uniref:Gustatory receptor n=1 Tax=Leptosia nina TaxID=320188 RepID=A0AAV1JEF1_9NEOP